MNIEIAGEAVTLDADRALVWGGVLVVADPHFGKDATARASAIPVPYGTTSSDLDRLDRLLTRHRCRKIWFLGDVFDSTHAREAETLSPLVEWRRKHAAAEISMVAGNHDRHALDLAERVGFLRLPDLATMGPWRLSHHPVETSSGYVLCGHVHPGLKMKGPARESLRLPAFIIQEHRAILPAFGEMTGLAICTLRGEDRGYLVVDDRIMGPVRPS